MTRMVLMLGNSLTTRNGLPDKVRELTGFPVWVHARGGARLAEHLNPTTMLGSRTKQRLAAGAADYVVMQEMSHGPLTSPDAYLKSVLALCERVHEAGATPVIYGTWAFAPGSEVLAKRGVTFEEMHERMHEMFVAAAEAGDAVLADVGSAFVEVGEPGLWDGDGVHPSEEGSTLAGYVIAEAILAHEKETGGLIVGDGLFGEFGDEICRHGLTGGDLVLCEGASDDEGGQDADARDRDSRTLRCPYCGAPLQGRAGYAAHLVSGCAFRQK